MEADLSEAKQALRAQRGQAFSAGEFNSRLTALLSMPKARHTYRGVRTSRGVLLLVLRWLGLALAVEADQGFCSSAHS